MNRSRFQTVAIVLSLFSCGDNPGAVVTSPIEGVPPTIPGSTAAIAGTIIVSGNGSDVVVELRDVDGDLVRLVGNQLSALASVDGGDVVAWGTFDANPGFVVNAFEVTGMHGRPALDGVLEQTAEGYGLRLLSGSLTLVPGITSESAQHVGERLWVVGWEGHSDVEFGVIASF